LTGLATPDRRLYPSQKAEVTVTTETTEPAVKRTTASTQLTVFLAHNTEVRSAAPPLSSLYIDPAGMGGGHSTTFMFGSNSSLDEQIAVADRILAGVQRWRDGIVDAAERRRTAEDELAAAREEIARLRAERDGGEDA
jgi:hypothetical protein